MSVPPSAGAVPPQSPLSTVCPWGGQEGTLRTGCGDRGHGQSLHRGHVWGCSEGAVTSVVFLSFILSGAAESPQKEAGGSPDTPGTGAGNNPWLSLDPQHLCVGTPWLVCPLCCPSWLVLGLPTARNSTEQHSTAPGTGGFPAGHSVPGASQGRLHPRVVFASAEGRGGSAPLSPPLPSSPAPRSPRLGAVGGTEPQPLGGPRKKAGT